MIVVNMVSLISHMGDLTKLDNLSLLNNLSTRECVWDMQQKVMHNYHYPLH